MAEATYSCPDCHRRFTLTEARELDFVCPDGSIPMRRVKESSVDLGAPALKGGTQMAALFREEKAPVAAAPVAVQAAERPRKSRSEAHSSEAHRDAPDAHSSEDRGAPRDMPRPPRLRERDPAPQPEPPARKSSKRRSEPQAPAAEQKGQRGSMMIASVLVLAAISLYALVRVGAIGPLTARIADLESENKTLTAQRDKSQKSLARLAARLDKAEKRLKTTVTHDEFDHRYAEVIPRTAEKCSTAVIHIINRHTAIVNNRKVRRGGVGSGFIIGDKRYAVTNYHVIHGANVVQVVLYNDYKVQATVHASDPVSDLALLRLNLEGVRGADKIIPSKLGSGIPRPGTPVIVIGSPKGMKRTVTRGVISYTRRYTNRQPIPKAWIASGTFNNWIQTDTAINPGNSGGPMFNLDGEVVGVVTRKLAQVGVDNVGFALPIDYVRDVIEQLKRRTVRRSTIGIFLQPYNPLVAGAHGVRILDVVPGSPADRSGIQRGDVLTHINGEKIRAPYNEDLPEIEQLLAKLPVNRQVAIMIQRGGSPQRRSVVPRVRTKADDKVQHFSQCGFFACAVTPELALEQGLRVNSGLWICGLQLGTLFANAGFKKGDVLLSVSHPQFQNKPLGSMAQAWTNIFGAMRKRLTPLAFTLMRGQQRRTINLNVNYGG